MSSGNLEKKAGGLAANAPVTHADLQENLRRLDRLANLGLVSASVAHEIKNGLVAINTFIELLLEKGEDRELSDVVRRELRRIDTLVTQMLRFAAPKPAALAAVHVNDLLDHSLRLLEHQMNERMITLQRDYRAAPDTLHGDESQLQQAFMNLLLNAVEAMSGSGRLTVVTETAAGPAGAPLLKISVSDTGMGIASDNLSRLFEPFFTTKKNGTGLGLAICQRIAHEHRGTIEVRSETGRGATFIVSLPAD
jgi:signal transduction histidine kinase